jgi:hypothetical protein
MGTEDKKFGLDAQAPTFKVVEDQGGFGFLNNPYHWFKQAAMLKNAADILHEEIVNGVDREWIFELQDPSESIKESMRAINLFGPCFLMLAGFAVENILKAVYLYKQREAPKRDSLPNEIKNHKLGELAKISGIDFPDATFDVCQFLGKLTQFVEWAGRYPIPVKDEKSRDVESSHLADSEKIDYVFETIRTQFQHIVDLEGGVMSLSTLSRTV